MKYGTLSPVWRNVPAEASRRRKPTHSLCSSNPAWTIIDLLTKPLKSGKAEIDKPADQREDKGPGHLLVKPAQLGELALAGHVQDRAAAHEEQALVEDVGEGVGAGAVDRHLGAEADARRPCSRPG